MFVDDVMGRSRKHRSCALHFSSPIDPLAHISADFPSLAQRDVKRPTSPPATCVRLERCAGNTYSLCDFSSFTVYLFHISSRNPFSWDITLRQRVNGFRRFERTVPSSSGVLEVRSDWSFRTSTPLKLSTSEFWP